MSNKKLYILWGVLAVLCVALSFITEVDETLAGFMALLALGFFVPPGIVLHRSVKRRDAKNLSVLRRISLVSLVLTFVVLLLNFLSFGSSVTVGDVLHVILVLVSVPMICSQYWVLSLFLWSLILIVTLKYRKIK